MHTNTCTLELSRVLGFAVGRNKGFGSPEPSPTSSFFKGSAHLREEDFLTHWGPPILPVPSCTDQEDAVAAPQMPLAGVEQVKASQAPRQTWEMGKREVIQTWSLQALRIPG